MRMGMAFPFVSDKVLTKNTLSTDNRAITNIVKLAVASLIYGEIDAPIVPIMLVHP